MAFNQDTFLTELGATETLFGAYRFGFNVITGADDPELAKLISQNSPAKLMDALSKAAPESADFFEAVKGNSQAEGSLAHAVHKATVNNPAIMTEISNVLGQGTEESKQLTSGLKEMLQDEGVRKNFTAAFDKIATNGDITFNNFKEFTVKQYRDFYTPERMLSKLETENPSLKGVVSQIRADGNLSSALHKAVMQDQTVMEGFKELVASDSSGELMGKLEKSLADPKNRQILTQALNNVAENEDITFANLTEFMNASLNFDTNDLEKSKSRLLDAMVGVGIERGAAEKSILEGQTDKMIEFMKGIFDDPELALGKLGMQLDKMGLPPEMVKMLTGFMSMAVKFLGGAKDLFLEGEAYEGYRGMFRDAGSALKKEGGRLAIKAGDVPTKVDRAAEVTATDDTIFSKNIATDLENSTSPITIGNIFDIMRKNTPDDANPEINHLEQHTAANDDSLTKTFKNMADGLNNGTITPEQAAETINNGYNKMEEDKTPRQAYTM